jgi:hypothetical protein
MFQRILSQLAAGKAPVIAKLMLIAAARAGNECLAVPTRA